MWHVGSCECTMGSVDLFSTPLTQTSIMKRSTLEFHPIANVGDEGPIEFYFPPSDEDHLDLNSHTLELRYKIVNSDGSDLKLTQKWVS